MATPLAQALLFIRHHQDGEIAEKMRNGGLQYNMIYGVSSLLLLNYAKSVGRNQELADLLWQENFREAKLMAFMLADYTSISDETISQYIAGFTNNEMVEIAVINLFSQLPNALQLLKKWIKSEYRYEKMAGYLTIERLAMRKQFGDENDLVDILHCYENDLLSTDYFVYQSVQKAFQELAFRRQDLKSLIIEKTKYICEQNKGTDFELQTSEMFRILEYC
ncbi:MAG: DNA alkylation repair protein [Bacteroidales bacterium]|nr:DNA alkylation repair protein [Bacteroidales bacterium]